MTVRHHPLRPGARRTHRRALARAWAARLRLVQDRPRRRPLPAGPPGLARDQAASVRAALDTTRPGSPHRRRRRRLRQCRLRRRRRSAEIYMIAVDPRATQGVASAAHRARARRNASPRSPSRSSPPVATPATPRPGRPTRRPGSPAAPRSGTPSASTEPREVLVCASNWSPVRANAQLASCATGFRDGSLVGWSGKGFLGMRQPLGRPDGGTRFPFWSLPARVKIPVLAVELLVVGVLAASIAACLAYGIEPAGPWAWLALALVVAGVASTEASLGVERKRRQSDDHPHLDLSSVWTFAGAVLLLVRWPPSCDGDLPAHLAPGLATQRGAAPPGAVYSTADDPARRAGRGGGHRPGGTRPAVRAGPGVLAVVAAMVVYMLVNLALVVLVIVVIGPDRRPTAVRRCDLGTVDDIALEFATLSPGRALAAVPRVQPVARPARAAAADGAAPRRPRPPARAAREHRRQDGPAQRGRLARRRPSARPAPRASPGRRLAGPHPRPRPLQVRQRHLRAPRGRRGAGRGRRALRAEVREGDLVGRFGGEEFVVLLRDLELTSAGRRQMAAAAERIRARVAGSRRGGGGAGDGGGRGAHRLDRGRHDPARRAGPRRAPRDRRCGDVRGQAGGPTWCAWVCRWAPHRSCAGRPRRPVQASGSVLAGPAERAAAASASAPRRPSRASRTAR